MISWVVGAGGLLGSALSERAGACYEPGPVPWRDPEQARRILREQARGLSAAADGRPWRVIWAAGAATTSTSREVAETELIPLEGLLSGLRSALPSGPGSFFLTSSAGGVYAGSSVAPFSIDTVPVPLSPYGELKVAQEAMSRDFLEGLAPVVIGRIGNLYGPGQNLQKLQGLISRLALAAVTREPLNVFVPLGTIRDYIYAADAADVILTATRRSQSQDQVPRTRVEIISSGTGTTIGQLIRTMDAITKRRIPVAFGSHPSSTAQALDLRLTPSLSPRRPTPLPAGMKAVYADILRRTQVEVLAGT